MVYKSKYAGAEVEALLDKAGTALQSVPDEYVTETELTIKGYATVDALNDKVDKADGKQLTTEDFTTTLKTKLEGLSNYDDSDIQEAVGGMQVQLNTLVSGDAATAIESFNEIIAFLDGVEDTETLEGIIASIEQQIAAKYTKPSSGIPKSDLASAVQTSLGKADTALQGYTEQYKGTITGVSANGTSVATSGVANIPAASTSAYGVTKLSSSTSSTSTTLAATSSAVKAAYDLANSKGNGTITGVTMNGVSKGTSGVVNLGTVITAHQDISGKQDKLVSGTNIKTINGASLLGSGNIVINNAYSEISHRTSDTTFTLTPNVFHIWDEVTSLTLTLGDEIAGVANEFLFQFTSGATATTLTLPDSLKWANDEAVVPEANKMYQFSIVRGGISVLSFNAE